MYQCHILAISCSIFSISHSDLKLWQRVFVFHIFVPFMAPRKLHFLFLSLKYFLRISVLKENFSKRSKYNFKLSYFSSTKMHLFKASNSILGKKSCFLKWCAHHKKGDLISFIKMGSTKNLNYVHFHKNGENSSNNAKNFTVKKIYEEQKVCQLNSSIQAFSRIFAILFQNKTETGRKL